MPCNRKRPDLAAAHVRYRKTCRRAQVKPDLPADCGAIHSVCDSAVSQIHAKNSVARWALHFALALASLVAAGRIIYLATSSSAVSQVEAQEAFVNRSTDPQAADVDAELASLYTSCPMAAVIDLKTVASSPQGVAELVPAYRALAHRVPDPPVEPAIPRIRYPVAVRPSSGSRLDGLDSVRIAQPPSTLHPEEKSGPGATASELSPGPSLKGRANVGEWLIDPREWYTPEEKAPSKSPETQPKSTEPQPKDESPQPPVAEEGNPAPASPPLDVAAPSPPLPPPSSRPLFSPPAATGELPAPPSNETDVGRGRPGSPDVPRNAGPAGVDPHLELFTKNAYPSARECAQCHEEIYNDWSISAHAYAAVSPMFHKFEQKLNDLSHGTLGYFCMRCHAPVATALCASRAEPLWNLPETAREGITCIACHRVQYVYGKSNGERRIEPGPIFSPVLGGIGGEGVAEAIHHKEQFKVKTSPDEKGPGLNIHAAGIFFEPLTRSEFCTPCHQVAVDPGIKLEVVWEQYRASPACKKGIQCQDCHMGRVPGLPLGYDCGPVAKIADKTVNDHRRKSNHIFYGPNYPIAHPGVFPFNLKAKRWTMEQWLTFDWRAGWGTKEFEKSVADGRLQASFPPVWAEADDRFDARDIIDENFKKLNHKRDVRSQIMENGSHVDGPFFDSPLCRGQDLNFHYVVTNTNEGHNLLTASLGAQPQLWADIVLIGPDGRRLWESGYTDSFGDLANIHSEDVRQHRAPYDFQLFNLQTMFLIQGATGTDREFLVPVNIDIDQLPFIRPGVQPISTINHPPGIRMESHSLAPLGSREALYHIPARFIQQSGTYRVSFRLRSRSEPMYLMRFVGATEEMQRAENEWMIDVHPMTVEFVVR